MNVVIFFMCFHTYCQYIMVINIFQLEFRLVIHGEKSSITLPKGKLTVKHWADLTHDDDTGLFSGFVTEISKSLKNSYWCLGDFCSDM